MANSNRIENETGSQNITNMWHDHHMQLFNSVIGTDDQPYVLSYIRNNVDATDAVVILLMKLYVLSNSIQTINLLDMMALKECIRYYAVHNTPIYVCFVDVSKAFDCINHWKLIRFLLIENALSMLSVTGIRNKVCVSNGMV